MADSDGHDASKGGVPRLNLTDCFVAAITPAVVLAVDPLGWYPFEPLRWLTVTVLVLVAATLVVTKGRAPVRLRPMVGWASVVLVASMVVAALVGLDGIYAWTGTPERHNGVAFWALCVVALVVGAASVGNRLLAPGLTAAGLALGLTATAEALGWEPDVFDAGSRLTGLMGSSAFLGAAAALLGPIAIGVAAGHGRWVLRSAAMVAAASTAVALVGSGARAAWVGVAVALLVVGWARRSALLRSARSMNAGVVAAGSVAVVAAAVVLVAVTPVGSRIGGLLDDDAPGGSGRVDEWRVATRVLADHPLTGVGPEGYRLAFADRVDAAYEARHGRDPLPDRAHSGPLDIALSGGPVALGAWLLVMAGIGRSGWRALRRGSPFAVGVASGLIAHWVGQMFLFPLAGVEPIAWMLGGWLVASDLAGDFDAVAGSKLFDDGDGQMRSGPVALAARRPARSVALAILTTLTAGALVTGGLGVLADREARKAADTGSVAAARNAVGLRPDVIRYHLLLARVRVANGHGLLVAIDDVDDALALSPRDPIVRLAKARYLVERALATEVPAHAVSARQEVWKLLADDPLETRAWALAVIVAAIEPSTR